MVVVEAVVVVIDSILTSLLCPQSAIETKKHCPG